MPSFKKASFNSNRDMKQNIRRDGGDGDGPRNNTSRRFQERVGGKKYGVITLYPSVDALRKCRPPLSRQIINPSRYCMLYEGMSIWQIGNGVEKKFASLILSLINQVCSSLNICINERLTPKLLDYYKHIDYRSEHVTTIMEGTVRFFFLLIYSSKKALIATKI